VRVAVLSAALVVGFWLTTISPAAAGAPDEIARLDQQFLCPESLATDQARERALHAFVTAYAHAAPDSTIADMLLFRRALLAKHGCRRTLEGLDAADAAVASGKDVQIQVWLPVFSSPLAALSLSTDHLALVVDPRFENERVVSGWMKLDFRSARVTNATHVRYDTVISHELFYCGTGRHALVENFYFLGGAEVLSEPEPSTSPGATNVYEVVPTDPQSFNAFAQKWACGSVEGQPA
jgi:hypothetical protein